MVAFRLPRKHEPRVGRETLPEKEKISEGRHRRSPEVRLCPWCLQWWEHPYKYIDTHLHRHIYKIHILKKERKSKRDEDNKPTVGGAKKVPGYSPHLPLSFKTLGVVIGT